MVSLGVGMCSLLDVIARCNLITYVAVMGQELYPLGTKVLIVLCQSESVVRRSSRSDTRDIRRQR